ncbi:hypothetical protein [Brunnivagina elsteri]|uniref:Uncharacterized protein n=1 Tax=Brunnivagina elsteri CCALA 953 TaxID=987040 RepID=A0A2A2TPC2_9CYAN|nr:hypothetical protein [Calothrix elsteri]PAX60361.1 hypothetical protein CK510_02295 [Calothrix elsteri CCALA 953]
MAILTNFLRSLALTIIFSFVAPLILIGAVLVTLSLTGHVPGLQDITGAIAHLILQFLATFGGGSSLEGIIIIGLTCSFVGVLFDTYVHYRDQILRLHS